MCKFFSLVSDGHGSIRYFGSKERLEIEEQGNPRKYSFNSHIKLNFLIKYFRPQFVSNNANEFRVKRTFLS